MANDEVLFRFRGQDEGLQREAQKAESSIQSIQATAQQASLAFGSIALAGGMVIKGWVDDAMEAERTSAQLNAVLKSTGGASGMTADSVKELAGSLAKVTAVGDDTILSGQNMLLTFTNIGKDVFPKATETMLDMATAMNSGVTPSAESLKGTAIQLGKALNDPEKGMTALTKVGVTFTEEQKKQIETMQKSGDIMGAQKVILDELSKEFGGSAKAAAATFGGQMENLNNRIHEIGETLGGYIIPVLQTFGKWIEKAVAWFEGLDEPVKKAIAQTALFVVAFSAVGAAIAGVIAVMSPVILIVDAIVLGVGLLYMAWQTNFLGIRDIATDAFGWISTKLKELWAFVGPTILEIVTLIKENFSILQSFIHDHWDTIKGIFTAAWDQIKMGWDLFWDTFIAAFKLAWVVFSGTVKTALQLLHGDFKGAFKTIQDTNKSTWDIIKDYAGSVVKDMRVDLLAKWNFIKDDVTGALFGPFQKGWSGFWDTVKGAVAGAAGSITAIINSLIGTINGAIRQLQTLVNTAAGMGGGGVLGALPRRATGGPVSAGTTYLVGENGPEPFTPSTSGYITPNNQIKSSGGDRTLVVHINGPISSKEYAMDLMNEAFKEFKSYSQTF